MGLPRATLRNQGALLLLAALSVPAPAFCQPVRPELDEDSKRRIVDLEKKVWELRTRGEYEAALPSAETVLSLRLQKQAIATDSAREPVEWWEVGDARRAVADLRFCAGLPVSERAALRDADAKEAELEKLYGLGEYQAAANIVREQLKARRNVLGSGHPDVARTICNLAALESLLGDHTTMESLMREAIAIQRKSLGAEHPDLAWNLNNFAEMLRTNAEYAAAETSIREAVAMRGRLLGNRHALYAESLNNLAAVLEDRGDYAAAEPIYREALEIRRSVLGAEHTDVAQTLNNLALLLQNIGDYVAAEPLMRDALSLFRANFGEKHPNVATCMNNLAALLHKQGDNRRAEELLRAALDMRRSLLPKEHPDIAGTLQNLASTLDAKGEHAEAASLHREAISLFRKQLGDNHVHVATATKTLALCLEQQGDFAAAEPLLHEALSIYRRVLGDQHPLVGDCRQELGRLLLRKSDHGEAAVQLQQALDTLDAARTRIVGDEEERARFGGILRLAETANRLSEALVLCGRQGEALDAMERGRSRAMLDLLARSDKDLRAEAVRRAGVESAAELDRLLEQEYAAHVAVVEAENTLAATTRRTDLREERDEILSKLSEKVQAGRRKLYDAEAAVMAKLRAVWPESRASNQAEIRAGLAPGECLISYAWLEEAVVLIAVFPGEEASVEGWILMAEEEEVRQLRSLVSEVRQDLSQLNRPQASRDSALQRQRELFSRLVPESLRSCLCSAPRVLLVPDGPLAGIPFEPLFLASCSNSSEQQPALAYSPSATMYANRRAAARKRTTEGTPSVLVLADPLFERERNSPPQPAAGALVLGVNGTPGTAGADLSRGDVIVRYDGMEITDSAQLTSLAAEVGAQMEAQTRRKERLTLSYWRAGKLEEAAVAPGALGLQLYEGPLSLGLEKLVEATRSLNDKTAMISELDRVRLYGGRLPSLPGTRKEAEAIAHQVHKVGGQVRSLFGEDATIANLERAVEGYRLVHLATHGLMGSVDRPYDASLALTQPLTPTTDDIGFLTLDRLLRKWQGKLAGCQLVVLAACDTQRGIAVGDSVMALPLGFFYAGAPTAIASLWRVDDASTTPLMARFYENVLGTFRDSRRTSGCNYRAGEPMSKLDALSDAKNWFRTRSREQLRAVSDELNRGFVGGQTARSEPIVDVDPSLPYYWAGFVLVGSPE